MEQSDITRYAGGRPSKLTDSLTVQFVSLLMRGYSFTRACHALNIDYSQYKRWMQRGESGEQPYCAFRAAVQHAKAERVQALLEKVERAADDDWKAAAWILERTVPEEFARVRPQDQQQPQQHQHLHLHVLAQARDAGIISDDQIAAIDAQIIQSRSEAPKAISPDTEDK